jgi:prolyl-tRNA synthetase
LLNSTICFPGDYTEERGPLGREVIKAALDNPDVRLPPCYQLRRQYSETDGFVSGEVPLERKIAVHAPSELVLYPSYAKWINSHRDLPLKLNQWHSVAQWEMKKDIPPLLQADEFLWQEAHTAHLTSQSAYDELEEITGLYAYIFEDLLAVPVTKGWNTQKGKSAGTLYTSSVEVYIPDAGYSIQGASCNGLGHNYSKIFGIAVEDPEKKSVGAESEKHLLHVWQNSWSLSSRAIGIMVMSHADERGIILPPRVAEIQAIIIPVGLGGLNHDERKKLHDEIRTLSSLLSSEGVRAESDIREGYSPGWKFNEWDLRGVPLRLHFGPEESAGDFVTAARRDIAGDDAKSTVLISNLTTGVLTLLYEIHNNLYSRVESKVRSQQRLVRTWPDFLPSIIEGKVCLAPHCLTEKCEHELENRVSLEAENQCRETKHASTTATTFKGLCVPFDQPEGIERGVTKCINPDCEQPAEKWCMFGCK